MEFPEVHTRPIADLDVDDSLKQPIIYTASLDGTIKIWDFKNPFARPAELLGHTDAVNCIKVRGNYVVSGSSDLTVRIWDKKKLACLSTITTHTSPVTGVKALEKVIFSFDRAGVVVVTKIKANEMKFKLDLGYPILNLRVQKKFLLVVGTKALETYTVKGKKIAAYEAHAGDITSADFYDQDYIFSTSVDRTTILWNVKRAQQMFSYRGHHSPVTGLAFYNQWVYTSAPDGTIRQWVNPVYDPQSDNNMEWIY
uniref:Uncharacterized protein n=1 Tax=Arcella intermedia TaxID=1963864 RepID=A0A6B2LD95_9EUKA